MTKRDELEERAAELALRRLHHDRPDRGGAEEAGLGAELADDPELRAEVRRYTDLLGLLPEALDERPPRPQVKERVLAAIRGADADGNPDPVNQHPVPAVPVAADRFRAPRWYGALAASLLLAVVALALFSGWLYVRVSAQQATIDRLADELTLVATPGVEVCPLRPTAAEAPYPEARGLLFLSGLRDRWYVRVANVEPAPEGREYRLWFVLGDEYRPVGVLRPGGDATVTLSGSDLPPDDRMTAAVVTLEPAGHAADHPTGPQVLFGDERMPMI